MKTWQLALILVVPVIATPVVVSCRTVARTQYGLELDSCIDKATTRAAADACIQAVQLQWNEAGAPPALVISTDGGHE